MSLINDALKRAKQAQKNLPPAPAAGPQLRPAELSPRHNTGKSNLLVPAAILTVIALLVVAIWRSSQRNQPQPAAPAALPVAPVPPIASAPAAAPVITKVEPGPSTDVPPVKPSPKLQAIFFGPRRPSAMVSGKSVLVGGRVGEFRVAAIEHGSITLTSATATNVLTLEQE